MEEPCDTTLARSRNDDFSAAAIDGMKVVFTRYPHARQAGKMVHFVDPAERLIHQFAVEY
jgi:hypothetical protein